MMFFSLKYETRIIFLKNHIEKGLESPLIFIYFFKMENKIRNKNSNVTHFLEKTSLSKTESKFRGHVTYWEGMCNAPSPDYDR